MSEALPRCCCFYCTLKRGFFETSVDKIVFKIYYGESRLSTFSILSDENGIVEKISFDDIISGFASAKARRVNF